MELEFLPPHVPTVEERADPKLFASNVRMEMAAALGIQLCDLRWPSLFFVLVFNIFPTVLRRSRASIPRRKKTRESERPS